jgi:hypothetical protein
VEYQWQTELRIHIRALTCKAAEAVSWKVEVVASEALVRMRPKFFASDIWIKSCICESVNEAFKSKKLIKAKQRGLSRDRA